MIGPARAPIGTIYQRLPHENAIRILEILGGAYADPVVCRLHVAGLPEAELTYSALSYTWQADYAQQPLQAISCNGSTVRIGKNLFDAIRRVRTPISSRLIWADALCINQDDVRERSTQVSRMNEIFRGAYEVLAWLGEETLPDQTYPRFRASVVFSDLCTIVNVWRDKSGNSSLVPKATYWSPDDGQASPPPPRNPGGYWWQETLRLFERRWFHRVWVIQEVALARSVRVLVGQYAISWEIVGLAAAILRTNFNRLVPTIATHHHRKPLFGFRTGVMNAYFMYRLSRSQSYIERITPDFHELLILTRGFDCQDDRDRIYGLLGLPFCRLSSADSSTFLIPDYSKTTAEVYRDAAEKILRESGCPRLLSSVQRPSPSAFDCGAFDADAPSWVPQWSFTETQSLSIFEQKGHSTSPEYAVEIIQSPGPARLRLRAVDLTAVSEVSTVGSLSDFCIPWWAVTKNKHLNVVGFKDGRMVRYPLEPTGEITDDMLSRNTTRKHLTEIAMTLTAGKDWNGGPVRDEAAHLGDFTRLLLDGGLLWCLADDAFGPDIDPDFEECTGTKYGYRKVISDVQFQHISASIGSMAENGSATSFLDTAATVGCGRRRFTTDSGLRGTGPGEMQLDDRICIIRGAVVPFVLRRVEASYQVVGECYVYVPGHVAWETAQRALQQDYGVDEKLIELI